MSIPGSANPLLFASVAAEAAGYQIDRSLRFNSSDSAYLSKNFGSAGNRKTWTVAFWIKNCIGTATGCIFGARSGSEFAFVVLSTSGDLGLQIGNGTPGNQQNIFAPGKYRDPSSWYHVVFSYDTTGTVVADMVKIYINGERVTPNITGNSNLAQNYETRLNNSVLHVWNQNTGYSNYGDYYLADCYFIDGQALDPTSFTEVDATTGQLVPIEYTGTYGTNGFHLDFADNSSAAALGYDAAGSNDWTVNNISVTAGSGNDSLVDTPTNAGTDTGVGGEVTGNYATLNPLNKHTSNNILSNGNLEFTSSANDATLTESTIAMSSGKFYFEVVYSGSQGTGQLAGIRKPGARNYNDSYIYVGTGNKYTNGGSGTSYGATLSNGDVIGTAFDADNGTLTFYKNGVSQGQAFSGISGTYSFLVGSFASTPTGVVNFGQRPFAYTAPSGFQAINTASLSDPTIADGSTVMDVVTYTGNGSTQTISGLGFSPDLVWIKNRAAADNHKLLDTIRGATNELESNTTDAEVANADGLTAFNSDGFSLGADVEYNTSSESYVAWTWDAGSSTVSNTDGSITSQVRANPTAGFSIVTYTGNGTTGATVGHGLNAAPQMIFTKMRNSGIANWNCWHTSLASGHFISLNTTNASGSQPAYFTTTLPTSSVFYLGNDSYGPNAGGITQVAYCFAPVDGYSSFGSYTGNGSATDGPFVYTGHRSRWLMVKRTDSTGNWVILDTARNPYNPSDTSLYADDSFQDYTPAQGWADILSNGFKPHATYAEINASGGTYIYVSFAESPFQYARAR